MNVNTWWRRLGGAVVVPACLLITACGSNGDAVQSQNVVVVGQHPFMEHQGMPTETAALGNK